MLSDLETNSYFTVADQPTLPFSTTSRQAQRQRFEDSPFPPDAMARQRMLAEMLNRRGSPHADDIAPQLRR